MSTIADLMVTLGLDSSGFDRGLKNASGEAKGAFSTVSVGAIAMGNVIASTVTSAFTMAGQAIMGMGMQALSGYEQYERLGMSLTSLSAREMLNAGTAKSLADAQGMASVRSEELLKWIEKLAVESPFKQSDVAQSFRLAMAYGFTTEEAQRMTKATMDFAAGSGATGESMGRIALALGQIKAKGKLAGQEVLQLTNAGLDVRGTLAQAFGVTTEELIKMQENGLIPADKAIEAIVKSLETDFADAGKKQSQTFSGLLSSLSDLQEISLRNLFGETFKEVQPYLASVVTLITDPKFQEGLKGFGKGVGEAFSGLLKNVDFNPDKFWEFYKNIREIVKRIVILFDQFDISGVIDGFVKAFDIKPLDINWGYLILKWFSDNIPKIRGWFDWLNSLDWESIWGKIRDALKGVWEYVSTLDWQSFIDAMANAFEWVKTEAPGIIDSFLATMGGIMTTLKPVFDFLLAHPEILVGLFAGADLAGGAVGGILSFAGAISTLAQPILFLITNWGAIAGAFSALPGILMTIGTAILPFIGWILLIVGVIAVLYLAWTNNWFGIQEATATALAWLMETFGGVIEGIVQAWSGLWMIIQGIWLAVTSLLSGDWDGFWKGLGMIVEGILTEIVGMFKVWFTLLVGVVKVGLTAFVTNMKIIWQDIPKFFTTEVPKLIDWFKKIKWNEIGKAIVDGIGKGIQDGWAWLSKILLRLSDDIIAFVKETLGIASPSTVATAIGNNFTKGLAIGFAQEVPSALGALYIPGADQVESDMLQRDSSNANTTNKYYGRVSLDLSNRDAQEIFDKVRVR